MIQEKQLTSELTLKEWIELVKKNPMEVGIKKITRQEGLFIVEWE